MVHELKDGFVERAVEVVVRDDKLRVKYFVGLNENTMADMLSSWSSAKATSNDEETAEKFQRVLLNKLASQIEIEIAGERKKLTGSTMELCPKHHFDFVASYELQLPSDQTLEIKITDKNFLANDSAARFAFKGVGSTMVSRVNVAPIIIRARRIEFGGVPQPERLESCKIVATIITPPSVAKNGNQTR